MNDQYVSILTDKVYEYLSNARMIAPATSTASVKWAIRDAITSLEKSK